MSDREMSWNAANFELQAVLADDPAFQAMAVEVEPERRLYVVVEPDRALSASSLAAIEQAREVLPVGAVAGVTRRVDLERARDAIEAALLRVPIRTSTKGLVITTDYRLGKVRLTGDVLRAREIIDASDADRALVIAEDGPGVRRVAR